MLPTAPNGASIGRSPERNGVLRQKELQESGLQELQKGERATAYRALKGRKMLQRKSLHIAKRFRPTFLTPLQPIPTLSRHFFLRPIRACCDGGVPRLKPHKR